MAKKRKISLKAIKAAIDSPKTPKALKKGLLLKYGDKLKKRYKGKNPEKDYLGSWKKIGKLKKHLIKEKLKKTQKKKAKLLGWKKKKEKKKNPPVEIYDKILKIEAQKGRDSNYPKEKFYHNFTKARAKVLGLPDGSLLIKGIKPLWKKIRQ